MNWTAIAAIGQAISSAAVVVSVIYLAVQVRHAANIARVEAHHKFNHTVLGVLNEITRDSDLHRVWRATLYHDVEPDEIDRERVGMLLFQVLSAYSACHKAALIDPALDQISQIGLEGYLSCRFVRDWWQRHEANFVEPFRSSVNARIRVLESLDESTRHST